MDTTGRRSKGHQGAGPPDRLFIKVVLPRQGRERAVSGGGSEAKPFRPVDGMLRESLGTRTSVLRKAIATSVRDFGSVPVRVQLIPKAYAKSHRPETLFSEQTCPIIGAGKLGELFIRATPSGLERLEGMIRTGDSKQVLKEISTIETIEAVTSDRRRQGVQPNDILRQSPRLKAGFAVRVQLFDVADGAAQQRLIASFRDVCKSSRTAVYTRGYSDASNALEVVCRNVNDVERLSGLISVRSVRAMPLVRTIRPRVLRTHPAPVRLPAPGLPLTSYPVVAVVDSGVRSNLSVLENWVLGRESTVAPEYRNEWHGTFVGGLISFGKTFNPRLNGIDEQPCAIFDLQVLPNTDPAFGDVEELRESEFLEALEEALKRHANEIKVWNLSLGTNEVCSLDEFSPTASGNSWKHVTY